MKIYIFIILNYYIQFSFIIKIYIIALKFKYLFNKNNIFYKKIDIKLI